MKFRIGNWYYNTYSKEYFVLVNDFSHYYVAYSLNECRAVTVPKYKRNRGSWSSSFVKPNSKKLERAIKKAISAKLKSALIQNYSEII